MHNLEAVVFDMDGTILHTFPDLARCANEALVQMGFPARSECVRVQSASSGTLWDTGEGTRLLRLFRLFPHALVDIHGLVGTAHCIDDELIYLRIVYHDAVRDAYLFPWVQS